MSFHKTICLKWLTGDCNNQFCGFRHPQTEDGYIPPRCINGIYCSNKNCNYNHVLCKHYQEGICYYGSKCHFQHSGKSTNVYELNQYK